MPYITQHRRRCLDEQFGDSILDLVDIGKYVDSTGELNYVLTKIVKGYFDSHLANYAAINDVLGALDGVKAEFYRRVAVPYEEAKIKANGDVYTNDDDYSDFRNCATK